MLAGGGAVLHPAHDPLQDACDAEHVVGHVEIEMRDAVAAGAPAIGGDVVLFGRDAKSGKIDTGNAPEGFRCQPPGHQVIGEVAERMPQCRELPVEHGDDARLGRMEDHVVHPEVAMHQRGFLAGRDIGRQPFDQPVHGRNLFGLRCLVLLAPAGDLAGKVIAGLAIGFQPDGLVVDLVQGGDGAVHGIEDAGPFIAAHARQALVPEDAALDAVHDVEGGADDAVVLAQAIAACHRNIGLCQRGDHAVFAVNRMGRWQQLAGRLASQHVFLRRGDQHEGRVRLAALELPDRQRALVVLHILFQPAFKRCLVETVALLYRHGAGEAVLVAHAVVSSYPWSRRWGGPGTR